MECHGFWFWFVRPIAEVLGSIAMIVGTLLLAALAFVVYAAFHKPSPKATTQPKDAGEVES